MIELDMHTLWIWIVLSEALFAVLLGIIWAVRRTEQALLYWTFASACLALGCLGISQRGQVADWLSIPVANVFFTLAWTLRWAGLRGFAGQPVRVLWYLGVPVLIGVIFQFRDVLGLSTGTRVAIAAVVGSSYAVMMIIDALRAQRDEPLVMRRFIVAISVLTLLFEITFGLYNQLGEPSQHFMHQSQANASLLLTLLMVFTLYDLACFLMVFERHESRLVRNATVDSLTNVLNRSGFSDLASRQLKRSSRDGKPVSVLVMDLDHFKRVNDFYGHEAGDAVLRAFAQAARAALRPTDLLCRAGGEEFWALLPNADRAEACRIAQRVCDQFRAVRVAFGEHRIATTVSIGAAEVSLPSESVQAAIARADLALYAGKAQGRDRVLASQANND